MARQRLTNRSAAADKTPFPGDVNQQRKDPEMDQYHTFEQTINHELPDMRTEWKNDQRNEIGFGIPTVASVRAAASQAVKLAVLLLGEKAPEDVIEAQAREFMKLGGKGLSASLLRFANTEKLYAEDMKPEDKKDEVKAAEDMKPEDKKDEVKASTPKCACGVGAEDKKEDMKVSAVKADEVKPEDKKDEVKAAEDMKPEDKKDEVKASKVKADDKKEDMKKEEVKAADEDKKDEMEVEASDEDKKDEEVKASDEDMKDEDDKEVAASELDVQLGSEEMDEPKADEKEEEMLASLYADDEEAMEEKKEDKTASAKKGIKKLGGQPIMASKSVKAGAEDLSNIWASAPDVSNIFE